VFISFIFIITTKQTRAKKHLINLGIVVLL